MCFGDNHSIRVYNQQASRAKLLWLPFQTDAVSSSSSDSSSDSASDDACSSGLSLHDEDDDDFAASRKRPKGNKKTAAAGRGKKKPIVTTKGRPPVATDIAGPTRAPARGRGRPRSTPLAAESTARSTVAPCDSANVGPISQDGVSAPLAMADVRSRSASEMNCTPERGYKSQQAVALKVDGTKGGTQSVSGPRGTSTSAATTLHSISTPAGPAAARLQPATAIPTPASSKGDGVILGCVSFPPRTGLSRPSGPGIGHSPVAGGLLTGVKRPGLRRTTPVPSLHGRG